MSLRINIGCGQTPTVGWMNVDNSMSLRLAKLPLLPSILYRLRLIHKQQYEFIQYAKRNKEIEHGNMIKGLPIKDHSVEVLYSSHMLEHLDCAGAGMFCAEAFRLLKPGGRIRIAVPDLKKMISNYQELGDADEFVKLTYMCVPSPRTLAQRLRFLFVGPRHHQWMYDGSSLVKLLENHGFVRAEIVPPGETRITGHGELNLRERHEASVYVEAEKPCQSRGPLHPPLPSVADRYPAGIG